MIYSGYFCIFSVILKEIVGDSFSCASQFLLEDGYNRHLRPDLNVTNIFIGLLLNRVSVVEEKKREVSFDGFVELSWVDKRISHAHEYITTCKDHFVELKMENRHNIWIPDLYSNQFREMKIRKHFQEISSIRIYGNSTIIFSFGAFIAARCAMNFALYPLDVQRCAIDMGSYKYSSDDIAFHWKPNEPVRYSSHFNQETFRLPNYLISFHNDNRSYTVNFDGSNHSAVRLIITLWRDMKRFLLEFYLPSTLFVVCSWGSFFVNPEIVPGRMVLLINLIYALIKMFGTIRNSSPKALEIKCIEVWILCCLFFVFLVLYEFFVVLFGIRYRKCFRKVKDKPPEAIANAAKIMADTGFTIGKFIEGSVRCRTKGQSKKLRKRIDKAVLFVGAERGKIDQIAVIMFPCLFVAFSIIYWIYYLHMAARTEL